MSLPAPLETLLTQTKAQLSLDFSDYLSNYEPAEIELAKAIEYALLNGGKRMRPLLVNIVGQMLKIPQSDLNQVALAIECIHAYSLVHDDLPAMDDDDLRRGKPTCHIQFNEATAILAGDALQCMAFEVIANAPLSQFADSQRIELIRHLTKAAGAAGMVGGQSIDLAATNMQIPIDALRNLHSLKTGALLSACVQLPCILCKDISPHNVQLLLKYAKHIGLAFQIQDDILDVTSDTTTLGKPQGSDQDANKSTFVSLLGLEGAQLALHEQHELALQALATLPYNTQNLIQFSEYLVARKY